MNIVFFGTGPFGLPALEALLKSGHRLEAVVTSPDKPSGRSLIPTPSVIKTWAKGHAIPVKDFGKGEIPQAQIFVVIDFGFILKEDLLKIPFLGALNVHASLLPKYRGAAPIQRAILNHEKKTGVSVIQMTPRLDAGDVIVHKETAIGPLEDAPALETRLAALGAEALLEALKKIEEKTANFSPQNEKEATLAPKISKSEGHIHWNEDSAAVVDHVRAMAGWPVAFCFHKGKRLMVLEAKPVQPFMDGSPGMVDVSPDRDRLIVSVVGGAVELLRVQLESKKAMSVREFLKGYPLQSGDMLE